MKKHAFNPPLDPGIEREARRSSIAATLLLFRLRCRYCYVKFLKLPFYRLRIHDPILHLRIKLARAKLKRIYARAEQFKQWL